MSSFLFDVFQMYEDAFAFHVPKSITKEKTELDAKDASYSRILTRFGKVKEISFGRFKKWRIINGIISFALIHNLQSLTLVQVLYAILNHLFEPLSKNNPEQDYIDFVELYKNNIECRNV
jgi:hypothetical protein